MSLAVAESLNAEHFEDMMAVAGEAVNFNVVIQPESYVEIRFGDLGIWDSEDENDGDFTREAVLAHCKKRLSMYAKMLTACSQSTK